MPPSPYRPLLEALYKLIFTDPEVLTHSPVKEKIIRLNELSDAIELELYRKVSEPTRESNV